MGHASPSELSDLTALVQALRLLAGVSETKPYVFYYRGGAFLHFHSDGARRWADVKGPDGWIEGNELPSPTTPAAEATLLEVVRRCHRDLEARRGPRK